MDMESIFALSRESLHPKLRAMINLLENNKNCDLKNNPYVPRLQIFGRMLLFNTEFKWSLFSIGEFSADANLPDLIKSLDYVIANSSSTYFKFESLPSEISVHVFEYLSSQGLKRIYNGPCWLYVRQVENFSFEQLENDNELEKDNLSCKNKRTNVLPPKYYFDDKNLTDSEILLINEKWPYKSSTSVQYWKYCSTVNPYLLIRYDASDEGDSKYNGSDEDNSSNINHINGKIDNIEDNDNQNCNNLEDHNKIDLCAWVFLNSDYSLGHLFVSPNHRRRGLARILISQFVNNIYLRCLNLDPSVEGSIYTYITDENKPSQDLFVNQLGWKPVLEAVWQGYQKQSN